MVEVYFDRLPSEILHNIALMLPFSSITQLKCSSKFWYNLLTDPKFVDLHLTRALQKPPGYLFTSLPRSWPGKKTCYFVEQSGGDLSISKMFEYSFDASEFEILASFQSSGGLMCAYSSQSCCFRIFNPHRAEEVQIPRDTNFKRWHFQRFFFYSPSIKEYKILKLGILYYCRSPVAEICTLDSNIIWRDVQNVPDKLWNEFQYTHCQGNPFWMGVSDLNLHYFDLVSEKFHVIPGPPVHDIVQETHDIHTRLKLMRTSLISMGDTVGYVRDNRLWVLEDKTKGIWINKYHFPIPPLNNFPKVIGTLENGHLFGYMEYINVFSHDMGCTGFNVMKLDDHYQEDEMQSSSRSAEYIAPHVRSLVSPIRIMKMGKNLNYKEKWVSDKLKLDYDATKVEIFNKMYEVLQAYEKGDKSQDL